MRSLRDTLRALGTQTLPPTPKDFIAEALCAVQRATRALLIVPGTPPSGRGNDRLTVRPPMTVLTPQ